MYLENTSEVSKVFERFDANSDGKISAEELAGVHETLGSATFSDEVDRMMREINTNRDNHIILDEFAAFYNGSANPYQSAEKELREAFKLYDQDHNDKIFVAELHEILTCLGKCFSENDCAMIIKSVDVDGYSFVNFHEFRKMMTSSKGNTASTAA